MDVWGIQGIHLSIYLCAMGAPNALVCLGAFRALRVISAPISFAQEMLQMIEVYLSSYLLKTPLGLVGLMSLYSPLAIVYLKSFGSLTARDAPSATNALIALRPSKY